MKVLKLPFQKLQLLIKMIEVTKAIVINTIKYGDTSLIATCYTENCGLKTYMLKGVLKAKKAKIKTMTTTKNRRTRNRIKKTTTKRIPKRKTLTKRTPPKNPAAAIPKNPGVKNLRKSDSR